MIRLLKKIKNLVINNIFPKDSNKNKVLLAQNLAINNRSLGSILDFKEVEFSCFSQYGEDGIIDWLISKLPNIPKKFVEFGVADYQESNTRLLLQLHNWQGLILDGSNEFMQKVKADDISWRHQIDTKCAHITRENINLLLEENKMIGEIGLLSIDIDGNDYHVWQSINVVNPVIVIVEYNAVLGDLHSITIPYRPDFFRTKAHSSNLYFGASLNALITLGIEKGYTFVGTNTNGVNAFFIRNDYASKITSLLSSISAYPSLFRESRDNEGRLTSVSGIDRFKIIKDCKFFDVIKKQNIKIDKLEEIYSPKWQKGEKNNF